MKMSEIIAELESKSFVKKILATEDVSNPTDVQKHKLSVKHVHFLDVSGSVMTATKAVLFVLDEGKETEEAYFADRYPQSRVQSNFIEREYVEGSDGSIKEVSKLSTSTGESKVIAETILKEAVTVEEPIKEVISK